MVAGEDEFVGSNRPSKLAILPRGPLKLGGSFPDPGNYVDKKQTDTRKPQPSI